MKEERQAVPGIFTRWNETHHEAILHPKMWEIASVPELGDHPQHLITPRLLDDSELLIAIFWSKLGTPTPSEKSGTVEEIREFIKKKGARRVMVYFCNRGLSPNINPAELARLQEFKAEMEKKGVLFEYETPKDFERELYYHLDSKISELLRGKLPEPEPETAGVDTREPTAASNTAHLGQLIDFGSSLPEISTRFAEKMADFAAIDGMGMYPRTKHHMQGAHVYASVANCLDRFLTFSRMRVEDRSPIERITHRLKQLASALPAPGAPFPNYWDDGRALSEELSTHIAHLDKWKRL